MYVLRESFIAKPGMASRLARLLKDVTSKMTGKKPRILTDMVGNFNYVEMETEIADLGALEALMKDYSSNQEIKDMMKDYTDLYVSGRREILKLA